MNKLRSRSPTRGSDGAPPGADACGLGIARSSSLASLLALLLVLGCESSPSSLSMVEKARQARLLREEAGDCHDRFVGSGGEALDQLECFAEKHRQTTEIYSLEESPDSYLNYARALRFLGNYHRLRALEHAKVMEEASSRSSVLAEKRREASEKARHYYRRSNEVFDRYFTVRPGGIAYLWASQNSEALEDYDKALRYLERYARSIESPTAEQVQALEDYRKRLEKLLEAETLEREQGRSGR